MRERKYNKEDGKTNGSFDKFFELKKISKIKRFISRGARSYDL